MFLIQLIVVLIVVGIGLTVLNRLPIDAFMKNILYCIALLLVCLWLLSAFGLLPGVRM